MIVAAAAAWIVTLRIDHTWPLAITLLLWLPYLPGSIPDAFLIWQGPIEGVVWALVIVGMMMASPLSFPRVILDPRRAPWIAAALLVIAAMAVFTQIRGVIPGGDEPHYLAATQSLLHDGDLRVANNYANGEYLDYFSGRLEPHFLKRSTRGEIYSIHAPGVSMIVLPAFALAGYPGAVAMMILIAAVTAALTWHLAFRLSQNAMSAWVAVGSIVATTPYFFHTFTIYPEIIGGLLVMIGTWLLFELNDARDVSPRTLALVGSAIAILPWLHSRFAVIAVMLGLIIIARLLQRSDAMKRIAAFLVVPVIAAIAWFAFFYVIWGSPSPTAPYGADTSTSASYILRGLSGSLFDQQFGVLTTAPVYLMAAAGTVVLLTRQSRLTIELILIAVPYAIAVASYAMWWAGNAAPARFLVAVLPVAALPIATIATEAATIVLLVISVVLVVPRAMFEGGRFIFNNRGGGDATIEWLTRSVDLSLAVPSVHRDGALAAVRDGVIWVVVFLAAVLIAALWTRARASAVRFAAAAAAAAFTAIVASTVVWSLYGRPFVTPDRSKLAALSAYRPSLHSVIVDSSRWTAADFLKNMTITVGLMPPIRLNRVPAGDYEVTAPEGSRIFVGRNDRALDQLTAAQNHLRLPVSVQTLFVSHVPMILRPVTVITPPTRRYAVRAARYGHARAFFFDEWAYPERDGFWTRANGSALVVIGADEMAASGLPISATAGAVPTTVTLSMGNWEESYKLAAGQKQDVVLPKADGGSWPLRIRSGAGFRPSEREPGSNDVRMLSAWIAIASQ